MYCVTGHLKNVSLTYLFLYCINKADIGHWSPEFMSQNITEKKSNIIREIHSEFLVLSEILFSECYFDSMLSLLLLVY